MSRLLSIAVAISVCVLASVTKPQNAKATSNVADNLPTPKEYLEIVKTRNGKQKQPVVTLPGEMASAFFEGARVYLAMGDFADADKVFGLAFDDSRPKVVHYQLQSYYAKAIKNSAKEKYKSVILEQSQVESIINMDLRYGHYILVGYDPELDFLLTLLADDEFREKAAKKLREVNSARSSDFVFSELRNPFYATAQMRPVYLELVKIASSLEGSIEKGKKEREEIMILKQVYDQLNPVFKDGKYKGAIDHADLLIKTYDKIIAEGKSKK